MTEYRVTFARSARHDLEVLSITVVNRVFPQIEALANQSRPPGCLKLRSWHDLWRIRVGDYRVIYSIDDAGKIVDIIYEGGSVVCQALYTRVSSFWVCLPPSRGD